VLGIEGSRRELSGNAFAPTKSIASAGVIVKVPSGLCITPIVFWGEERTILVNLAIALESGSSVLICQ
jgi:hypothetical protein